MKSNIDFKILCKDGQKIGRKPDRMGTQIENPAKLGTGRKSCKGRNGMGRLIENTARDVTGTQI